jgi:hypothetical protein
VDEKELGQRTGSEVISENDRGERTPKSGLS